MNDLTTFECGTCLDFGYLPGIGPCPHCQPDEHTEHVLAWIESHAADHQEAVA